MKLTRKRLMEMAGLPINEVADQDAGYGVIENLLDRTPDNFSEEIADESMAEQPAKPADLIASLEAGDWGSSDEYEVEWFEELIAYMKKKDPSINAMSLKKATEAIQM